MPDGEQILNFQALEGKQAGGGRGSRQRGSTGLGIPGRRPGAQTFLCPAWSRGGSPHLSVPLRHQDCAAYSAARL